jgi:hypothetical protein
MGIGGPKIMDITKDTCENIKRVYDNSGLLIERTRVEFTNGWMLSIIRGQGTYGYEEGLYECAAMHRIHGDYILVYGVPGIGCDVRGHMTRDDVIDLICQFAARQCAHDSDFLVKAWTTRYIGDGHEECDA